MCGIIGWAGPTNPPFSINTFEMATRLLAHRGPDDQGVWSEDGVMLGHRRLSIIDLSEAGHQPMHSASQRNHIVYNGEIYNHIELGRDLLRSNHKIKGGSDTGVLLELFESQGVEALNKLNGMFAFAVWNSETRKLWLCRDRFGIKPLYYRHGSDGLAFASEPKALLAMYPDSRCINSKALLSFLGHNELHGSGQSFYENILTLPPAHWAVYDAKTNTLRIKRYWEYPAEETEAFSLNPNQAREQFAELLDSAVQLRLRSDVPIGLTLSGGLDSSAILTSASKNLRHPLRCFTSVYGSDSGLGGTGELEWAKIAVSNANGLLTPVNALRKDWLKTMSDISWHMDGPGYSPAVYPLWQLMEYARKEGVPVLLEGQGADESLGGYPQYAVLDLLDNLGLMSLSSPRGTIRRLSRLGETFSWKWALAWLVREQFPQALRWHRQRTGFQSLIRSNISLPPEETNMDITINGGSRVGRRLRIDHGRAILPGLLQYGDAISMAHSIETRNPFMDYRLVEWLFKAPSTIKLHEGQTKWVLREYLRVNGQKTIGNRPDKRGYPTPTGVWLASEEGRAIESEILRRGNPLHEWCNPSQLAGLFERQRQGTLGSEHHLYKIVSTQIWMDRCLKRET